MQLAEANELGDTAIAAGLEALPVITRNRVSGKSNDQRAYLLFLQGPGSLIAIHLGHFDYGEPGDS